MGLPGSHLGSQALLQCLFLPGKSGILTWQRNVVCKVRTLHLKFLFSFIEKTNKQTTVHNAFGKFIALCRAALTADLQLGHLQGELRKTWVLAEICPAVFFIGWD